MFSCPICYRRIIGGIEAEGYNPEPLPFFLGEVVCGDCYTNFVLPARRLRDNELYEEMERFIQDTTGLEFC
jgi:hypothetical protein